MTTFIGKIRGIELQPEGTGLSSSLIISGYIDNHAHEIRQYGTREQIRKVFDLYGLDKEITITTNGEEL